MTTITWDDYQQRIPSYPVGALLKLISSLVVKPSNASRTVDLYFQSDIDIQVTSHIDEEYQDISPSVLNDSYVIAFEDAISEMSELILECSQPNWDGYNANPLDFESLIKGTQFLASIPFVIPFSSFFVHTDGRFGIRLQNQGSSMSICVDRNNNVSYAGLLNDEEVMGTFVFNGESLAKAFSTALFKIYDPDRDATRTA